MNLCIERQLIRREYNNNKWVYPNYNEVMKKMQCNKVFSFCCSLLPSDFNNSNVPVSTCKFSNNCNDVLAVANENGIVCIQNVNNYKDNTFVQTHKNTVYDIAWVPRNSQFITVSGDNLAKLWDCSESSVNLISVFRGHKRSVRCVTFKPENTAVFATGSRDGSLMIWDIRAQKKCTKFSHHLPDQIISTGAGSPQCNVGKRNISLECVNSKSVTGLVFQNDNTLISSGSMDNVIRVWDMRKTYSRSVSNAVAKYQLSSPSAGFSYICVNSIGTKLYANCMDSYIYCFNINSYDPEPVAAFYGHENGSFYVKSSISYDGNYLLSGSSDENAYIWSTKNAELSEYAVKPFVVLTSHTAEVTCVEMSSSNVVIISCSDDGTFRLWNPFKVSKSEDSKIGIAACYDVEDVSTVKTKWKNKRKFETTKKEVDSSKINDSVHHSKICRIYNQNVSLCLKNHNESIRIKRPNEDDSSEIEKSKKKAFFAMQQLTPPKQEECKRSLPAEFVVSISPKKRVMSPVKVSSKRKLEDMPSFIEESVMKTKKINCGRVLVSANVMGDNKVNKKFYDEEKFDEMLCKTQNQNILKENKLEDDQMRTQNNLLVGLASPTSNLPNYVEDGTSPYIHKCRKVIHKENDWLTKLQKSYKTMKTPEREKVENSSSLTTLSSERKKKNKNVDHTLHRYFKVSSKTTEKSYSIQDIKKKSIFIK